MLKPELPIWRGRRGIVNTAVCCLLGLLTGFALWTFAERTTVVPACTAYARQHGLVYVDFKAEERRNDSGVDCVVRRDDGSTTDVSLRDVVPYVTDQWVGLAMGLQLTVPLFAILFALARAGIYDGCEGVTR